MASGPLRVLRIITRLNVGGPSYQAIFLTERLQDAEFQTRLLTGEVGPREGSMEGLARARGVRPVRVPGLGREVSLRSDLRTVARLYGEMRRYRPDIVHTHLAKAGALGRLAARLARVPRVVHTYHGHVFHGYFSPAKSALFARIERALARWTDRIIVLGEAQEREILGYGVGRPEQMARIPLGLELEPFLQAETLRGRLRAGLGIAPEVPLVGIVARLVPVKAHSLFLRAARGVLDSRPDARFLIVGDGELREPLQRQARDYGMRIAERGPPDEVLPVPGGEALTTHHSPLSTHDWNVAFLGFRSDLPAIYADLDAVVLCSVNEGLPVTLIEALAAARPVVATDVGAVRDLVAPAETGLLVSSGDAEGLARSVLEQIEKPREAEAMGRRGRERVYPRLSIEQLEREIRALYGGLAGSASGKTAR